MNDRMAITNLVMSEDINKRLTDDIEVLKSLYNTLLTSSNTTDEQDRAVLMAIRLYEHIDYITKFADKDENIPFF